MSTFRTPPADLPRTVGDLRQSGWRSRSVKDEVRENLMRALRDGGDLFPGVIGYQQTVIPQVVNALLSRHDLILLGLRGQAKTRLARGLGRFLDEWMPVVAGSPIHEDPFQPVLARTRDLLEEQGDKAPLTWVHRDDRYQEKLATPDITMADLIGDVDPIKAASEGRDLMDPEVIQFGLVPRTARGIFTVNELPDLPTRIQVGLFNILEEKDVQIRGFPFRLPLDLLLVFTANPEDYTNRGSIVTPLRDRIRSQIHTHYPMSLDEGMRITTQESWTARERGPTVTVPEFLREAVEETAVQARTSSFVDQSSGVSARVTISLMENVISNAERRALRHGEAEVCARPADLFAALPGLLGKIELVFEGEQEGPVAVGRHLLGKGLKAVFDRRLEDPVRASGQEGATAYDAILGYFKTGKTVALSEDASDRETHQALYAVPDLKKLAVARLEPRSAGEEAAAMELVLEGLHQSSLLAKQALASGARYSDQFDDLVKGLQDQ